MFATLCMGKVRAIILMDSEAEPAFERADVVLEEVGVFVEIDCFEGEFAQALAAVGVGGGGGGDAAATEFGTGAILVVHCGVCRWSAVRSSER